MRTLPRIAGRCRGKSKGQPSLTEPGRELLGLASRVELSQALMPLGLQAVNDLLQEEVTALVGERYRAHGGHGDLRWRRQGGSVYLADQKVAVTAARVRDRGGEQQVPLGTYRAVGPSSQRWARSSKGPAAATTSSASSQQAAALKTVRTELGLLG
jgi:hypothetical protein